MNIEDEKWIYHYLSGEIRREGSDAYIDFNDEEEAGQLAAAAPAMARALLLIYRTVRLPPEAEEALWTAIRQAKLSFPSSTAF